MIAILFASLVASAIQRDIPCDACVKLYNLIELEISSGLPVDKIISKIQQLCKVFPASMKQPCEKVIASIEYIVSSIKSGADANVVCEALGICSKASLKARLPKTISRPVNDEACGACSILVLTIRTLADFGQSQDEIAEYLKEELCPSSSVTIRPVCESIANTYLSLVLSLIVKEDDDFVVCGKIGYCNTIKNEKPKKNTMMRIPPKIALPKGYDNGIGCTMCTTVVDLVKFLLDTAELEEEIAKQVAKLCTTFPDPYGSVCTTLLERFIPIIITWLNQGIEPTTVCSYIGLCEAPSKKVTVVNRRNRPAINRRLGDDYPTCIICKQIVSKVDELLEDKKLEEEITAAIVEYCQLLPSPYSSLCSAYVQSGIPVVIKYIQDGFDAFDVCTSLKLCDKTEGSLSKTHKRRPTSTSSPKSLNILNMINDLKRSKVLNGLDGLNGLIDCPICKQGVEFVKRQLVNENVEQHVAALVSQLCTRLPETLSDLCNTATLQYIPVLMKLLDEQLEPLSICVSFGMCTAASSSVSSIRGRIPKSQIPKQVEYVPVEPMKLPADYNNGYGCDMCGKIIDYIQQLLADEKVDEEITKLIEALCPAFPAPYSSICNTVVEQYVPILIIWVKGGIAKADICTKIGLCLN